MLLAHGWVYWEERSPTYGVFPLKMGSDRALGVVALGCCWRGCEGWGDWGRSLFLLFQTPHPGFSQAILRGEISSNLPEFRLDRQAFLICLQYSAS